MSGLIITPAQDVAARAAAPAPLRIGVGVTGDAVEGPGEPPARAALPSDRLRPDLRSPAFLARHAADLAVAGSLGAQLVLLGVSWARLCPEAPGRASRAALDAYSRVLDGALACGLSPVAWLAAPSLGAGLPFPHPGAFADVAESASRAWGDRADFVTLRDPGGLVLAAPRSEARALASRLAQAHALAADAMRAASTRRVRVGLGVGVVSGRPASSAVADARAARSFELAATGAWLALARGREALAAAPAPDAAALDVLAHAGDPCEVVVLLPRGPHVVRAGEPPRPAQEPGTDTAGVALAAAWREAVADAPAIEAWIATALPEARPGADGEDDAGRQAVLAAHATVRAAQRAGLPATAWIAGELLDGFDADGSFRRTGLLSVDLDAGAREIRGRARALASLRERA